MLKQLHSCCLWVICNHKQTKEIRFSVLSPRTVTAWLKSSAPILIPVCWWLDPLMTWYPPFHRLKEQKNLNSFFAVMFGLGNSAVHRLHKTWEVRAASVQHQLLTLTVPVVVSLFMLLLVAENPQQDKKNLLCVREADGKTSCLDCISGRVVHFTTSSGDAPSLYLNPL